MAPLIDGMQGMEGWLGFELGRVIAVSYTHLTLPTSDLV